MPNDDVTEQRNRAFLFSLRPDGSPTCHAMVAFADTGDVVFNTYGMSAKAKNLIRDPRAAVLLLDDWQVKPDTAQSVSGRAFPSEESEPPASSIARAKTPTIPKAMGEAVASRLAEGKRVLFRLKREG